MQKLIIEGGNKLSGEIKVQGAKNSALPLLAACILMDGKTVLHNCPDLSDVDAACRILSGLGAKCRRDGSSVTVDTSNISSFEVPDRLMHEMRSSIVFLGAILGRLGKCKLSFPGGCELGPRPIDLHISALSKMGVTINEEHGYLECSADKGLKGARLLLSFPSVGATENIMLAAVTASGTTEIENAAREPEIVDLADFLNKCGAKIYGAGESTIRIEGVSKLTPCEHKVIPDRIVAVTYLSCAAITGSELILSDASIKDISAVVPVFEQMGAKIYSYSDKIYINAKNEMRAVQTVRTLPFPGFPTDAQALIMAVTTKCKGVSVFIENIFESRYKHVGELRRMGAKIKTEGRMAIVEGVPNLSGAKVSATDLRGGAALVIAGLSANGKTEIDNIKHIDRGYEHIEKSLSMVGARIFRE